MSADYDVFDFTGNGTPELFIHIVRSMAEMQLIIYSYQENKAKIIFNEPISHTTVHKSNDGSFVLIYGAHMGWYRCDMIYCKKGRVEGETLFEGGNQFNGEYPKIPMPYLEDHLCSDKSYLRKAFKLSNSSTATRPRTNRSKR